MLSKDEKIKCVELFEWATDETTNANDWNESAANLLAEMYAQIIDCSTKFSFVPKPTGSKPGWSWLLKYAYDVISIRFTGNKRKIYETCLVVRSAQYKRLIQIELATGGQ